MLLWRCLETQNQLRFFNGNQHRHCRCVSAQKIVFGSAQSQNTMYANQLWRIRWPYHELPKMQCYKLQKAV